MTACTIVFKKESFKLRAQNIIQLGTCCARDNTELAGVDDHRVSYFLSPSVFKMWFFGMQAVSGRIYRPKKYA